jgi:SAM-dependent methyltransferase
MVSKEKAREIAKSIAQTHLARGDANGWFEELYQSAGDDLSIVPWANLRPSPNLVDWLRRENIQGLSRSALTVGCGLGDDAEELARAGFRVVAFDVAPTAIENCRRRFPASPVEYIVANLFEPPAAWRHAFELVFDANTIQALPPQKRPSVIGQIASFVAPGGQLLIISRARNSSDLPAELPWPMTEDEVRSFQDHGLALVELEDFLDREDPPVRRFRACFQRPA